MDWEEHKGGWLYFWEISKEEPCEKKYWGSQMRFNIVEVLKKCEQNNWYNLEDLLLKYNELKKNDQILQWVIAAARFEGRLKPTLQIQNQGAGIRIKRKENFDDLQDSRNKENFEDRKDIKLNEKQNINAQQKRTKLINDNKMHTLESLKSDKEKNEVDKEIRQEHKPAAMFPGSDIEIKEKTSPRQSTMKQKEKETVVKRMQLRKRKYKETDITTEQHKKQETNISSLDTANTTAQSHDIIGEQTKEEKLWHQNTVCKFWETETWKNNPLLILCKINKIKKENHAEIGGRYKKWLLEVEDVYLKRKILFKGKKINREQKRQIAEHLSVCDTPIEKQKLLYKVWKWSRRILNTTNCNKSPIYYTGCSWNIRRKLIEKYNKEKWFEKTDLTKIGHKLNLEEPPSFLNIWIINKQKVLQILEENIIQDIWWEEIMSTKSPLKKNIMRTRLDSNICPRKSGKELWEEMKILQSNHIGTCVMPPNVMKLWEIQHFSQEEELDHDMRRGCPTSEDLVSISEGDWDEISSDSSSYNEPLLIEKEVDVIKDHVLSFREKKQGTSDNKGINPEENFYGEIWAKEKKGHYYIWLTREEEQTMEKSNQITKYISIIHIVANANKPEGKGCWRKIRSKWIRQGTLSKDLNGKKYYQFEPAKQSLKTADFY